MATNNPQKPAEWTLTAKEVRLLELKSQGHTYPQIAKIEGVSPSTIATRAAWVLFKCNAPDITAAVYSAAKTGIITVLVAVSVTTLFNTDTVFRARRTVRRARSVREFTIASRASGSSNDNYLEPAINFMGEFPEINLPTAGLSAFEYKVAA